MNKIYFTLLLVAFASGVFSQNNQPMKRDYYENEWAKVAEFEDKSLPQSASETVNTILRKAIADKNSPQIIKALIHQGKYDLVLDGENDTAIFRSLSEILAGSGDAVEQSVLHSMLGELYLQYYQKDGWNIDQRTDLGDYVPADMKEWTRNIFYSRAMEHLNASVAPREELLRAEVESYAAVVELGKDSRIFYPSMYDFLIRRAIQLSAQIAPEGELSALLAKKNISLPSLFAPANEFVKLSFDPQPQEYTLWVLENYKKLLSSLLQRNLDKSTLLVELEKSDYLGTLSYAHLSLVQPALEKLLEKWAGNEMSVEIIHKLSPFYLHETDLMAIEDTTLKKQKIGELYTLLKKTVAAFPQYARISILENSLSRLTQSVFTITGGSTFAQEGEKKLRVEFCNIRSLTAKLYRLNSPMEMLQGRSLGRDKIAENRVFIKEIQIPLPDLPEYWTGETFFTVDPGGLGTYMLVFSSSPASDDNGGTDYYFSVSDLAVFSRGTSGGRYDFFVVDRTTGAPVPNASVNIYKLPANWNNSWLTLDRSITTNTLGLAVYDKKIPNNDIFYHAVSGNDKGSVLTSLPDLPYNYSDREIRPQEITNIFTDRSFYRPGQTVHFKAVQVRTVLGEPSAVTGKSIELVLRDANRREIAKQVMTTNEFGSVSGEFILPQAVLPGHFTIAAGQGSVGFRVEEYKRPTFEITFNKIEKTYQFGEEITLKGKARSFSGINLQQANVDYRITRRQAWWRTGNGAVEHYTAGSVTTGDDGGFEISFTPEKSDAQRTSSPSIYFFSIETTVTDSNGETQTATYNVTVGDLSMILFLEMPERWVKEGDQKIVITAKNFDGNDVAAGGTYRLFSLEENDSIRQLVAEGVFKTGEQPALKKQLSGLSSGKYRLKLQSKDDKGNPVETEKDILLFSYSDKRPPVKTNEWFIEKNNRFSPGKNAEIILGVSEKVHILYELWQENSLLERKWIVLNNENRLFSLPYKEQYKEGVTLMLTYVKNEKFYAHKVNLLPEKEKMELKVKLDLFRDKIRPGSQEEWRITVTGKDGDPSRAEVLASMYDFSLDNIYPSQNWNFSSFPFARYFSKMGLVSDRSFLGENAVGYVPGSEKEVKSFVFDRFNWFDYSLFYYGRMMFRGAKAGAAQLQSYAVSEETLMVEDSAMKSVGTAAQEEIEITGRESLPPPSPVPPAPGQSGQGDGAPQVRRNFNETAFFFPRLTTNEKGETQIAFTVPESNTRWRFRLLAHDKKMNTGSAEAFTLSQKELMVTPNMPRFLRHGDRTAISSKISNLSDGTVSGTVKLEFFDPTTEKPFSDISIENKEQPFSLQQGASSDAWWIFDVPAAIDLLGVRIIARSEQFSDGEQHALAVLPNRMLVTESMRMDLNGSQTKEFAMERLIHKPSPTIEDYRLTLEFASNPAWYAVQALPVLGEPESDNAVSWFASYYANSLGAHIGEAFPGVKTMVAAWKKQGGDKETFLSNLEKNPALKNVLLEETPWVLEAKNEAEQKERLSLLFDLNRGRNLTATAIAKLQDLQTNRGGWSWFKGFDPSVSITQYILYGFHQLKQLKAVEFTGELLSMQEKALSYIDTEAVRRFDAWKKHDKAWKNAKTIPVADLEYLYVRSGYTDHPLKKEVKEMADFYRSVIEKNWTRYSLYERSLIAVMMSREGKTDVVRSMLDSFREHAIRSEEMGMYWANNRAPVFMSQSSVSLHTFIMEAFRAGGAKAGEMDDMKRWLLKQKQTQLWETTHATADAVYALLSTGSDWFSTAGETVISVGGVRVEPEEREAGSGYFKKWWSGAEITPAMGQVTVVHQGNAPAWGALYWQYFEDMDKIEKTDASLDIEKRLFVEQTTAAGKQLVRITEESPLKVGDKVVVRLTVRSDRDMEFLHLKDMRAAAFEPASQISGLGWQNGIPYYQTSKDASTGFYFNNLPRGTYLFEYAVYVNRPGSYSNGITTIQSMYAPEFTSHTAGMRIIVKE